ncbi:ATP:cob(I)alamin adenosyltransferase [Labedella gwakjiensis]|uniref:ATP:cob(I)alamin adenosyltransferase n=1 Tax=Labedella gwakjiensis TaxID=390269 RepID=A0A2P8GU95_9MICO|nr:heme-binding protein [Labedella gwakjiensis]PSL37538.1 ATP:cob(I)alamin adenosyltransferase [Labedella gwakjiensis]RUQ84838.1 heme-binding protein [Labedella gwakjiensis]
MTNTPPAARMVRALSYAEARELLDAALRRAEEIGVPASVSILDATREVVAFGRQDGAPLLTGEVATAKAYTAASLRQPSGDLAAATSPTGPFAGLAHGSTRGLITFAGGYPLIVDGEVAGAVGASGGSIEEDVAIATAAVELFAGWQR